MAIDWYEVAKSKGYDTPNALLVALYWDERKTMLQVAEELGFSTWSIWAALRKFNVVIRPRGGLRVKRRHGNKEADD